MMQYVNNLTKCKQGKKTRYAA